MFWGCECAGGIASGDSGLISGSGRAVAGLARAAVPQMVVADVVSEVQGGAGEGRAYDLWHLPPRWYAAPHAPRQG